MSPAVLVRPAAGADAKALAAIYNEGVAGGGAVFDRSPIDAETAAGWIAADLPLLVAERDGQVAGFVRLSPYSDHCVERGIAEHGVYVAAAARGAGVGRALLQAAAQAAAEAGLYKLTARILDGNEASLAVHRASGFTEVGVQRRHGRIDGEWRDCVLVERLVGEAET